MGVEVNQIKNEVQVVDRRSNSLIKPFVFFSVELILIFELVYILSLFNVYTLILSLPLSLYFIYTSSIARLTRIVNRVVERREKELLAKSS